MRTAVNHVRGKFFVFLIGAMAGIFAARAETITGTPDAYLEYVAGENEQYIDTGVKPSIGLKARIDMKWKALYSVSGTTTNYFDWSFLEARGSGDTRFYMLHLNQNNVSTNRQPTIAYGYAGFHRTGVRPSSDRHEIVSDFTDSNAIQIYQNGAPTINATDQASLASTSFTIPNYNLYLFACNDQGTPKWMSNGSLYGLKMFKKNDETGKLDLIRHYLPCLKNGRAALYEKVEGKIYFSNSTKDFVAGPELPRPAEMVEWVQSNNKDYQFLDTGVYAKSGLRSEVDFIHRDANQVSGHTDVDRCVLGARTANSGAAAASRYYLTYFYQGVFCYGYRNLYYKGGSNINEVSAVNGATSGKHYLVKSDLSAGNQSVTVNGTELHKDGIAHDETYFATGNDLSLFVMHLGTGHTCHSAVRLFYAKIWDGDELLRDFVPCVDSTGKAGLYDGVTERIFYLGENKVFDPTNCVGAVTNWLSLADGTLPDAKISYIESDGTNDYFDVDVMAKDGVEMEAEMEWLTVPYDGAFVSARNVDNTSRFFLYHYYNGYHRIGYASQLYAIGDAAAVVGQRYRILSRLDAGKQTASVSERVNGVWSQPQSISRTEAGPVNTGLSLCLFARNIDNYVDYPGHARVYKLKFREKQQDGSYKLTRDFVPVVKGGKAMLFDKVSGRFFRNKGRYLAIGGGAERPIFVGTRIIFK